MVENISRDDGIALTKEERENKAYLEVMVLR